MNKFLLGGLVVAVLAVAAFMVTRSPVAPLPPSGAMSGTESTNDFSCNAGVCTYFLRQPFRPATSTLVSIKTPPATTTLASAGAITCNFVTTATYSTNYMLGAATTPYATTTSLIAQWTIPANGTGNGRTFTSTTTNSLVDNVLAPNTYINFAVSTSTGGASSLFTPVGSCSVILRGV